MVRIANKQEKKRIAVILQTICATGIRVSELSAITALSIKSGMVFCTSAKKAIDHTYIWREMKKLCEEAGISKDKIFPHNLRHLFAKCFYQVNKDIARLADILGHSSIETTRTYIKTSLLEHRKELVYYIIDI